MADRSQREIPNQLIEIPILFHLDFPIGEKNGELGSEVSDAILFDLSADDLRDVLEGSYLDDDDVAAPQIAAISGGELRSD